MIDIETYHKALFLVAGVESNVDERWATLRSRKNLAKTFEKLGFPPEDDDDDVFFLVRPSTHSELHITNGDNIWYFRVSAEALLSDSPKQFYADVIKELKAEAADPDPERKP